MIAAADAARQPAVLSGGLSRGLCLINKAVASARSGGKRSALPRMLCLQGSPDATQQYIAVMNSIFAAQVEIGCPHPCSPYKALSMWHCLRLSHKTESATQTQLWYAWPNLVTQSLAWVQPIEGYIIISKADNA